MITFFLLNFLAGISAYMVIKFLIETETFTDYIIIFFLVFYGQIIIIEQFLGILGLLTLKSLLIANFFIFAVLSAVFKFYNFKPITSFFRHFAEFKAGLKFSKLQYFCLAVLFGFGLSKITVNLLNPPFGWDSLNYHFTFAVEWLKNANLNAPIVVFDDPAPTYYPLNGSLFYLWLIFPFKSVFIADIGQLPFFIIAAAAVYGISLKIGLTKENSFYSAVLFALIPNFFKQLQIAYVDIIVGALYLVCVNRLFLLKEKINAQNVFIYCLSLGLMIGTKTTVLPLSILLIIPFIYIILKDRRRLSFTLIAVVCLIIFGGYGYIRNILETGNPLYPLDFKLLNLHIFKGVMAKDIYAQHVVAWDHSLAKMLFHEGLGAQALLLILPAVFLALPLALIKKRKLDFNLGYILLLPALIYLVYRYVIPLPNLRYLYALMGLGVVFGFYILELLKVKKPVFSILVIICIFSSISNLAKRQELVSALIFSVLIFFALVFLKKSKSFTGGKLFFTAFMTLMLAAFIAAEKFYKTNEFSRYSKMIKYSGFWPDAASAWDWLNSNTTGNNIAYCGRPVPFPLYGTGFKNNVGYVSVNRSDPVKLHDFKTGHYDWSGYEGLHENLEKEGNYRENASYLDWLNNLLRRNIEYLFIYSLHRTKETSFPVENQWAANNPKIFLPVFENKTIKIYKIAK